MRGSKQCSDFAPALGCEHRHPTLEVPLTQLIQEPAHVYHAQSRSYLSSHQLADFRRGPRMYQARRSGELPDDDRTAFHLGRAAHVLILEGQAKFDELYAVGGPINPRTGKPYGANTKKFLAWAQSSGKEAVTEEQFDALQRMNRSVHELPAAIDLLGTGVAERVLRIEYCGIPCQIRLDWFDPFQGIADLKTTDDLDHFAEDIRSFGYVHQLAFYRGVLAQAIGVPMPAYLIGVEKQAPYRCGVWQIARSSLDQAQCENESAIAQLKECQAQDRWPTGYESVRTFDLNQAA